MAQTNKMNNNDIYGITCLPPYFVVVVCESLQSSFPCSAVFNTDRQNNQRGTFLRFAHWQGGLHLQFFLAPYLPHVHGKEL